MTPPARGGPDTAGMLEAITDELAGWPLGSGYYQCTVGTDDAQEMADRLLPVVQRLAVEKAAEATTAVRELAEHSVDGTVSAGAVLRALAAAAQKED